MDDYSTLEQDAGYILTENLQDRSVRAGLSLSGWKPGKNMAAQATEFWEFDWEYSFSPVRDGGNGFVPTILSRFLHRKNQVRSSQLSTM